MERYRSHILIILLFAHGLMLSLVNAAVTNITTDQNALLVLKARITHDPYNILANNWSTTTSVCNWIGVTCGVRHRRVTALNISYLSFVGTIPPQLGNLSFLAVLDMTNNSFHGSLPDDFNTQIPSWFDSLPKLEHLILYGNNFVGTKPISLGNISLLQQLDLSYNQISGTIPSSIFNISSLEVLDLSDNQLSAQWANTKLKLYTNSDNGLSGPIPRDIFGYIPNLKFFYVSGNMFDGEIPSTLSKCKQLQSLSLSLNYFTGAIPNAIGNLTKLQTMFLGHNKLQGSIPSEISDLRSLVVLSLQNNSLTGLIPSVIFNISRIEVIALYMNRLSGQLPSSIDLSGVIPNSISNASQLIHLELGRNLFSGPVLTTLGELRNLQRLNIQSNQLTEEPSTQELTFLSSLTNCKHLTKLVLSDNPLDGTFPTSIGNLSAIQKFLANSCKIKGSIPQATGSILTEIGEMRQLQVLNLNSNRLQGSIPSEICNLRNLGDLYLSDNKFSGPVPACLSSVTSLRVLHLNSNNLTSKIPSSLWSLRDIVDLNLSNNSLIGHLPMDIGNLRVVIHIDLAWNELTCEIPSSIGNIQTLVNFSITHNELKGRIPESFGNLVSLELLDLSSNNLSGAIPKSLEKLRYLKYMNVSLNRLDGEIPTGGAFANFSAESFIDNGQLCDAPRLQVPPCETRTHRQSKTTKLVRLICILFAIALAIVVLALIIQWFRSQKRKTNSLDREDVSTLATWRRIPYDELYRATNGFDESNLLGTEGFGSIYKGKLLDGKDIAIKVFNLQLERALKSFDDECEVMSKICRRNLVKIVSCCSNWDFKALELEYMPNGSLKKWLYSHNYFLDILQRLNIMIDVASALEYLHHGYGTPIVHSDIKPSNIMLDEDMVAHVGDFGIAKLLDEEDSMTQTHTLATVGYMAPEYGSEGIVSVRRDMYSFGILLMETFTRKKPTDNMFEEGISLKCWVQKALPQSVNEVADANLLGEENLTSTKDCISSILELAVDCSEDLPKRRLEIINVLRSLVNIRTRFQKSLGTQ
ncbi:hypothetical protein ACOSP7_011799 [Xanthoceras sorbifolium]